MLVKRVLNPAKKNNIHGDHLYLLFLGTDAVLFDDLWDAPIIYGPKALVRNAINDDKKVPAYLPKTVTEITLCVYEIQNNGELKRKGEPIKGKPTDITVPNY